MENETTDAVKIRGITAVRKEFMTINDEFPPIERWHAYSKNYFNSLVMVHSVIRTDRENVCFRVVDGTKLSQSSPYKMMGFLDEHIREVICPPTPLLAKIPQEYLVDIIAFDHFAENAKSLKSMEVILVRNIHGYWKNGETWFQLHGIKNNKNPWHRGIYRVPEELKDDPRVVMSCRSMKSLIRQYSHPVPAADGDDPCPKRSKMALPDDQNQEEDVNSTTAPGNTVENVSTPTTPQIASPQPADVSIQPADDSRHSTDVSRITTPADVTTVSNPVDVSSLATPVSMKKPRPSELPLQPCCSREDAEAVDSTSECFSRSLNESCENSRINQEKSTSLNEDNQHATTSAVVNSPVRPMTIEDRMAVLEKEVSRLPVLEKEVSRLQAVHNSDRQEIETLKKSVAKLKNEVRTWEAQSTVLNAGPMKTASSDVVPATPSALPTSENQGNRSAKQSTPRRRKNESPHPAMLSSTTHQQQTYVILDSQERRWDESDENDNNKSSDVSERDYVPSNTSNEGIGIVRKSSKPRRAKGNVCYTRTKIIGRNASQSTGTSRLKTVDVRRKTAAAANTAVKSSDVGKSKVRKSRPTRQTVTSTTMKGYKKLKTVDVRRKTAAAANTAVKSSDVGTSKVRKGRPTRQTVTSTTMEGYKKGSKALKRKMLNQTGSDVASNPRPPAIRLEGGRNLRKKT